MIWLTLLACGPKTAPNNNGPDSGWLLESGDRSACFVAPDFAAIDDAALREKQQRDTVRAMSLQWAGARRDGVDFGQDRAAELEALLLSDMSDVQAISSKNLEFCLGVTRNGNTTSSWGSWVEELQAEYKEAACPEPLDDDIYHPMDLSFGWQLDLPLCAGQALQIKADAGQYYVLTEGGPELNVLGDSESDPSAEYLCTTCSPGVLLARFEPDGTGEVKVFEVGDAKSFTAPSAGTLSVAINDADYSDNAWRVQDAVQDGLTLVVKAK
ncbi:MAG: hypothetical protein ACI9VR_004748 [Cognaticolwellia sp.]|jgi:hypothetical protein